MKAGRFPSVVLLVVLALASCAPVPPPGGVQPGERPDAAVRMPQRTLVIVVRQDLPSLAANPLVGYSGSLHPPLYLFNATLARIDENEVAHPYLVEALPQLNTDNWRVFPDGRMETTYRLKPNLTWHDGAPLSGEDFAFALRVYATPEFGVSGSAPVRLMQEIVTPDPRTVVIKWREPYSDAGVLERGFPPLPRHILEEPFKAASGADTDPFVNHRFWTFEYVGLGPYRVEQFEPGAFLEAAAFDGHALGRPKIDRLRVIPIGDPNTALANMLSGNAHYIVDFILGFEEGLTLEREWAARDGGVVHFAPVLLRFSQIQHRPEHVKPKAFLDVRVRRAIAHAFDTPGGLEVMAGGRGVITWTLTSPRAEYYPAIERVITKRPHDPRRTGQLLEEAGFTRGADGFYVSPTGERLELEIWNTGGTFEPENRIFADSLRKAGIDASPHTLGAARLRDQQFRALLPGLFTGGASTLDRRLRQHSIQDIARPENRWAGNNRGGWHNEEYQRLFDAYNVTLDRSERVQQLAQMERLLSEDVGSIPHYFTVVVTAHSGNLKGPVARTTPEAPTAIYKVWTWEWLS